MARGYAVFVNGDIVVPTVGPTRRSAIVNWLVVNGILVFNSMSDGDIEAMWEKHVARTKLELGSDIRAGIVVIEPEV